MADNPTHYKGDLPRVLLDEAKQVIAQGGIEALTLRSLARRVGVSHAAPGHHFGSRDGLLNQLAVEGFERLRDRMRGEQRQLPPTAGGAERLAAAGRGYVRFSEEEPALFAVMFQFAQHDWSDPDLAGAGLGALQVLTGAVDEVVQAHDLDAHARQTLVIEAWSLVHGLASLWHSRPLRAAFPESTLDQLAASIPAAFVAAVARRQSDPEGDS